MKNTKEYEAREKRIIQYIKDGLTAEDIGQREGLRPDYALKERKAIAIKHGLTIKRGRKQVMPFGLDEETRIFRTRLGDRVFRLLTVRKMDPIEITKLVGIPRKLQKKTYEKPINYDWSVSEMQRLAKVLGVPFHQMMKEILSEVEDGIA
jgi:hypothetical protein